MYVLFNFNFLIINWIVIFVCNEWGIVIKFIIKGMGVKFFVEVYI